MGAKQSSFLYSPLEFFDWHQKNPSGNLEEFLVFRLETTMGVKATDGWIQFIKSMNHKIRCASEGWSIQPKIQFDIVKLHNGTYLPRLQKIFDAV